MSKSTEDNDLLNKFTYKELRQIWTPLTEYCNNNYTKTLTPKDLLNIKKRWIHFYSLENFTLSETLTIIDDYTRDDNELQSIKGH